MYRPEVGTTLTIFLPGESLRAPVARVVDRDTVLIELVVPPLNQARLHTYRLGDIVPVRRAQGELGEFWEAVDERRLAPDPEAAPRKKAPAKKAPARSKPKAGSKPKKAPPKAKAKAKAKAKPGGKRRAMVG